MTDDGMPFLGHVYYKPASHAWTSQVLAAPDRQYNLTLPTQTKYGNRYALYAGEHTFTSAPALTTAASVSSGQHTRALRALLPQVGDGASLINFVLELKDLRRMFHIWNKKYSKSKNLSGGYLNANFGWIPFISDLKAIYSGLKNLRKKLRWLRENRGKVLTRHLKWVIAKGEAKVGRKDYSLYGIDDYFLTTGDRLLRDELVTWDHSYHASMVYKYTIDNLSYLEMKVLGFLEALGVQLDPSIIWNAIPFSFVIDWVIDVGSFLRSFSVSNIGLKTEVLDFCYSVKSFQRSDLILTRCDKYYNPATFEPILCSQSIRSRYERKVQMPNLHALTGSAINLREITLAGALLLANRRDRTITRRRPTLAADGKISFSEPW
jgi:hypothetical protein